MTDLNGTTRKPFVQPTFRRRTNSNQSFGDRLLVCKGLTRVWIPGPPNDPDIQKPTATLSFAGYEISLYPEAQEAAMKPTPAGTGDVKFPSEEKSHGLVWGPQVWQTSKPDSAKKNEALAKELRSLSMRLHGCTSEADLPPCCKDIPIFGRKWRAPPKSDVEVETSEKKSDEAVPLSKEDARHAVNKVLEPLMKAGSSKKESAGAALTARVKSENDPLAKAFKYMFDDNAIESSEKSPVGTVTCNKEGAKRTSASAPEGVMGSEASKETPIWAVPFGNDAKRTSASAPEGVMDPETSRKTPAGAVPFSKEDAKRAWARAPEGILGAWTPKKKSTGLIQVVRGMGVETSKKNPGAPEMRGYSPGAKGKAPATTTGSDQDDEGYMDIVNSPTPGKVHYRPYIVGGDESFWMIDNGGRYVKLPIKDIVGRAGHWSNTSSGEPFFVCKGQAVRKSDLKFFKSLREDLDGEKGA